MIFIPFRNTHTGINGNVWEIKSKTGKNVQIFFIHFIESGGSHMRHLTNVLGLQHWFLFSTGFNHVIQTNNVLSASSIRLSREREKKIFLFFLLWRLPFDWKTPNGYLIALLAECAAGASIAICCTSVTCFLIESCLLTIAMLEDIANDLSGLSLIGSTAKTGYNKIETQFYGIVRNYSDIKQLSEIFNSSLVDFF